MTQEANVSELTSNNTVLCFGLDTDTFKLIQEACCKVSIPGVVEANDTTDLLAIPSFLNVCDFSGINKKDLKELYNDIYELAQHDSKYLFLMVAKPTLAPPCRLAKHFIRKPEPFDAHSFKLILLKYRNAASRHHNKVNAYDKKLYRLFKSLRMLRQNKIIYTRDLCTEFDVTPRTISRDMALMEAAGEPIEYDKSQKGYRTLGPIIGI